MFIPAPSQNLLEGKIGCGPFGCLECFSTCRYYFNVIELTLTRLYQNLSTNWKYVSTRIYACRQACFLLILRIIKIPTTEYVAPLGSSSLVFNFLFARFLVGTPVTSTDIYVRPYNFLLLFTINIFYRVPLSSFSA
jgi:hypothetical protein